MIEALINKLIKEGKLAEQKAGIIQVEALLKESIIDLKEAKKILHIADRATYEDKHQDVFKIKSRSDLFLASEVSLGTGLKLNLGVDEPVIEIASPRFAGLAMTAGRARTHRHYFWEK